MPTIKRYDHVIEIYDYFVIEGYEDRAYGHKYSRFKRYRENEWYYELAEEWLECGADWAAELEALYLAHLQELFRAH